MSQSRKIRLLLKSLTLRKLWNVARLRLSYYGSKWQGKMRHRGMPMKIGFEPTTSCNLRCPECPSGLRSFSRPTGMAERNLFESVVDQLHKDLLYLLLYFQGEPYLNPQFLEMAKYASSKNVYTATSTNGHYLTPENTKKTIESGISELIISIDGTTQETYEQYRVGGDLEKVKEGVRCLMAMRKQLKSQTPFVILQFLVVKPNEHQLDEIKELARELGVDHLSLKTAQIYDYKQGSDLIPSIDKYSRYAQNTDGTWRIKSKLHNQCWKLWQGAEITWDGKVLPCCFDKDAQYEMGNLQADSFQSVWRSAAYDRFRGALLKNRKGIDICTNCTEGL